MNQIKKFSICIFFIFILSFEVSVGQQVPLNPISYRIFSPFVFNPAIAGSKDFFSVDLIGYWQGKSESQILSGNTRLKKTVPGYFSSPDAFQFTNIGVGGYLFNEKNGSNRNLGIGASSSYHFTLDKQSLSFLSVGASVKGVYNIYSGDPDLAKPSKNTFYPNLDLGVYYYSPALFAGLSTTNFLGNPGDPDTLGIYGVPVSRQYFFLAGYKIILSRSLNIVLEPSIIINTDDSFSEKITDILEPQLKLYLENFCVGTYFNDYSKISFFLQYRYPGFYIGTFFQIPRDSPYYKKELTAELAVGINLSGVRSGSGGHYHW